MMADSRRQSPMPPGRPDMAGIQQPIDEAVNSAFNGPDQSYDPKLIAQITENVIKQLRLSNAQGKQPSSQPASSPTAPDEDQHATDARSTPPPPPSSSSEMHLPSSPIKHTESTDEMSVEQKKDSAAIDENESGHDRSKDETPLDKIWGRLFDEHGYPTARLAQLFRGIATHLIAEYQPKDSIVVTPDKMLEYYRRAKLDKELYPWAVLFDDERTYVSRMYRDTGCQHHLVQEDNFKRPDIPGLTPAGFSKWMTQMLLAHPDEEFERLKKIVVHIPIDNPDDKTERFPKDISRHLFPAVADVKVRNFMRRSMRKHAESGLIDPPEDDCSCSDLSSEKPRSPEQAPSDRTRARRTTENDKSRDPERANARKNTPPGPNQDPPRLHVPTVGAGDSAIPDDEHLKPTQPIERERKPYSATPGGGRVYGDPVIQPAGGRTTTLYPTKSASAAPPAGLAAGPGSNRTQPIPIPTAAGGGPPPPLSPGGVGAPLRHSVSHPVQGSFSPPKYSPPPMAGTSGVARSNSTSSRGHTYPLGQGHPGPTSHPGSSYAAATSPGPEIHQQIPPPPPPSGSRRGSFNRRRAQSGGGQYLNSSSASDMMSSSMPPFMPGTSGSSFDSRQQQQQQPVYSERAGGYDGYGAYDEEAAVRRWNDASGHPPPPPAGSGRRESRDRRNSAPRRERDSSRRSDDYYRDGGSRY